MARHGRFDSGETAEFFHQTPEPMKKRLLLLCCGLLSLTGCMQTVSPWERGTLAKPQMALVPNVQHSALMLHTYGSKEASYGGYGVGGGGCGCN